MTPRLNLWGILYNSLSEAQAERWQNFLLSNGQRRKAQVWNVRTSRSLSSDRHTFRARNESIIRVKPLYRALAPLRGKLTDLCLQRTSHRDMPPNGHKKVRWVLYHPRWHLPPLRWDSISGGFRYPLGSTDRDSGSEGMGVWCAIPSEAWGKPPDPQN